MFKETPRGSMSSIVKPLSAITVSPFEKGRLKKPLRSTISLSDMLPVYTGSYPIKVKKPFWVKFPLMPLKLYGAFMN